MLRTHLKWESASVDQRETVIQSPKGLPLIVESLFKVLSYYCIVFFSKMNSSADPRRPEREVRYKPTVSSSQAQPGDNSTPDYMNIFGMIFSMCGLMMRLKWCAWVALYCSCISFANSKVSDDTKQILSSFMLSISAVVMSYLQNPQPMIPPWASAIQ